MPVRLLVLGVTGMLGHQLWRLAKADPRFGAWGTARDEAPLESSGRTAGSRLYACDARDEEQVRRVVGRGFDVVINCIASTSRIAPDPVQTIEINSLFPHRLAQACSETGSRLIQISSDAVFAGSKGNYREDDIPDPVDLYGRSKLLGEVAYDGHLTVRTAFIGSELHTHHGLLEWFLAQEGAVTGYANVFWSGFTSLALSQILLELALRPEAEGVMHVAGERSDKYSLLCMLKAAYQRDDVVIQPSEELRLDRSLDNARFRALGIPYLPLEQMVAEMASEGRLPDRERTSGARPHA